MICFARVQKFNFETSVVPQKFTKEAGGLPTVMPAKAGIQNIQKHLIFLDSGSR